MAEDKPHGDYIWDEFERGLSPQAKFLILDARTCDLNDRLRAIEAKAGSGIKVKSATFFDERQLYHMRHGNAVDELFRLQHRAPTGCRRNYTTKIFGGDAAQVDCGCGVVFHFGGAEIARTMDGLAKGREFDTYWGTLFHPWWQTVAKMARIIRWEPNDYESA